MFNQEYVGKIMDLYGVNQLLVTRDGKVYAPNPAGAHNEVIGLMFDTDTADGSLVAAAIDKAKVD